MPDSKERGDLGRGTRELVRQWGRFKDRESVLYHRIYTPYSSLQLVHSCYDWPNMYADIEKWCKNCKRFALSKVPQTKVQIFMVALM